MAQLVFVHGVATRGSPDEDAKVKNRNALFKELLFNGADVGIQSPLWGDLVPRIEAEVFNINHDVTTFSLNVGQAPGLGAGLGAGAVSLGADNLSIVALGQQDPIAALDEICAEIAVRVNAEKRAFKPEEMQAFRTASALIAAGKSDTLFTATVTAQQMTAALTAGAPGAYGITNVVGAAIMGATDRIRNAAATLGFDAVRGKLSPAVARFIGDAFVYINQGKEREQIRATIRQALLIAHEAKQAGKGPIVAVGHSLGGVILIDMLSDPKAAGLPDELGIDALLTVGSQPGLFASLNVIAPVTPRRRPEAVKLWLNVFDAIDPFAFRADMVFGGVEDCVFNSMAGMMDTHSKYFERPQFYARARKRLLDAGVLKAVS